MESEEAGRTIKFGTDGWRGVIADSFTFSNVRWVAQALADYIRDNGRERQGLVVGYDTRFLSQQFAQEAARVLAANGIRVFLTAECAPTPAVSFSVRSLDAAGAVMVTASHNPYQYNGLKFKAHYAGSANESITREIEKRLEQNISSEKNPLIMDFEQAAHQDIISLFDPKRDYVEHIMGLIDLNKIGRSGVKVVVDPMHGASVGYIKDILLGLGCDVIEIRSERNPSFGGVNPEPIEANLRALSVAVIESGADIGLATDGDGDRIGAVDPAGGFINSHQIFALLLQHLVMHRGWSGVVVKTVSTTQMIDVLCSRFGLELWETPIGFKHICEVMLNEDVLIGGEESGGIGIKGHIPERDGILSGLLLVEVIGNHNKKISHILRELSQEIGHFYYSRVDIPILPALRNKIAEGLNLMHKRRLNGARVVKTNRTDGTKFLLEGNRWLLLRLSGTEPAVRIYAEADDPGQVDQLLKEGQEALSSVCNR